jgi:hypothetical protein
LFLAGKTGPLGIDNNGDRVNSYQLQIGKGSAFVRFANYFGTSNAYMFLNETIIWPGGGTTAPLGRPACGFDNELCPPEVKGTDI